MQPNPMNKAETRKVFNGILKDARSMAGIHGDEYYQRQEKLNLQLKWFVRHNLTFLTATQLLQLCTLVSKFRPVEPFSFLVSCSLLLNEDYSPKY
jgi:hypothetical protein